MTRKTLPFYLLVFALLLLVQLAVHGQKKGALARPGPSVFKEGATVPYAPRSSGSHASAKTTTIAATPLGSMPNINSSLEPMNNCVYANDSTGLVIFIHRNNPNVWGGTAFDLRYDISTDRGQTWTNDIGGLNPTTVSGRYPQIAGYYASGSAAPLSGRAIWLTDHFSTPSWIGLSAGATELVTSGSPATQEMILPQSTEWPSGGMTQGLSGEYWAARFSSDGTSITDTMRIFKGVYTPGTQSVAWSLHAIQPMGWNLAPQGFASAVSPSVAFSPDGSIGWIAALGDLTTGNDSVFSPILLKSTDAGATWGSPVEIDLNSFAWVYDSLRSLWIDSLGQPASNGVATAAFDYDLTVDANGNPHMFFVIGTAGTGGVYSIASSLAKYAVDLTSTNQGNTFDLRMVAPVLTFRTQDFGATSTTFNMDNYPQIARTHDGSHIFYTWVDSDTALVTGNMNGIGYGQSMNLAPNLWMAGYRVSDGFFTCIQPLTALDLVWEGRAIDPQMAPEVLVSGSGLSTTYHLPIVIAEMPALEPVDPCNNYYMGNDAVITESQFSFTPGSTITWNGCGVNPGVAAHIQGKVYADYNANGTFDGGDVVIPNHMVTTTGITYGDLTNSSGDFSILCAPNQTYGLQVTSLSSTAWTQTQPTTAYSLTPAAMATLTGNDFGFSPVGLSEDLAVTMVVPPMRSGFASQATIYISNYGTQASSGTLTWVYDSLVSVMGASLAYASNNTSTYTVTWNLPVIPVFGTLAINVNTFLQIGVPISTNLTFQAQVTTAGTDVNGYNNFFTGNCIVIGSYDPNDKAATPAGVGPAHQVLPGTPLSYRIRCQNTGTASAINVVVRDTLDSDLDISTFKMLEASHPYTLTVENGRILVWDFSGINLPDSFSNEPASHAHIDFSIAPKVGLPHGTVVDNSASIYFDFNAPVLTNVATITYDVPAGVSTSSSSDITLRIYPHPVGDRTTVEYQHHDGKPWSFTLTDLRGRTVLQENGITTSMYDMQRGQLPAGAYLYQVAAPGHLPKVGKMILQ